MKAIVYTEYGSPDVLQFKEVATPKPKENEVLIQVRAASVNQGDWHLLRGEPFLVRPDSGLLRPRYPILGADVAGQVVTIGSHVKQFQPGDEVFGDLSGCGRGGFAEYVAAPEKALALKPANVTFEEAAAVPTAAVTALQGLRDKGEIRAGEKVLINGASGGVGTFAVQTARSFGTEVTAVCSTGKMKMVRAIGADRVINYTQEDFTHNGQRYDLIFDTVGNHSVAEYERVLRPNGNFVTTAFLPALILLGPWRAMTGANKMSNMMAQPSSQDLVFLKELLEAGKVVPVIDRRYPLSEVPDALRYVGEGHASGKVVITV